MFFFFYLTLTTRLLSLFRYVLLRTNTQQDCAQLLKDLAQISL